MITESRHKEWLNSYSQFVARHRLWVVLTCLAACLVAASGGRLIRFDDNVRYFFKADNPQLVAAEELEAVYTKDDNILFALSSDTGKADKATFEALEALTTQAWKIPYATRVDSVTNFQHSYAEGDDLIVGDLIEQASAMSPGDIEAKTKVALGEPLLVGRLISPEGKVVAANVTLTLPGERDNEQSPSVEAARKIAQAIEHDYPSVDVRLGGIALLNHTFPEAAKSDLQTLVPAMYVILLVALGWLLRSAWAVLITALVIVLSTVSAVGIAGWLGIKLSPPSTTATTMIMTLAVADCVHLLTTALLRMRKGVRKEDAIRESLVSNFRAVFLTTVTTAVGFLSMNFSTIQPLNDLGNITTFGVIVAFILSVTFLPALFTMLPIRQALGSRSKAPRMEGFANWVIRRRPWLLWAPLGCMALLASFITANRAEDRFVQYFDESFEFRRDADFIMNHLTGIYTLEFSLDSGQPGGVSDPEYLEKLDQFTEWYREQPGVVHVSSFSDTMKRLNRNMNADDPSHYRLPTEKPLAAQYLLFFEMSLPYGLDLNNMLNVKKSSSRFIVTLRDVTSVRMRELAEQGEGWLHQNALPSMRTKPSSTSLMFAYASGSNIANMVPGTALAFALISLLLVLAFRSFRYGLLGIVPNAAPAIAAFGLWGILVGTVNFGLAMVATMSLGIIVDDTIHLFSKYLNARRAGAMPEDAIRRAVAEVGPALIITSVVLVLGFGAVALSSFGINAGMGRLTAITIAFALAGDLLFLPALLLTLDGRRVAHKGSVPVLHPAE